MADNRKSGYTFEGADRNTKGSELTEWMMKVMDTWGQRERGMLFGRREEEQTQWVMGLQTNGMQKEKACYSREEEQTVGVGGDRKMQGGREK